MTNWGKPDFDTSEKIDYESLWARIRAEGGMTEWPSDLRVERGYTPSDVQKYCVRDDTWQKRRLSMKGLPTHKKLAILRDWWFNAPRLGGYDTHVVEVQVGNYLGALRRGGQLNERNQVRKYI